MLRLTCCSCLQPCLVLTPVMDCPIRKVSVRRRLSGTVDSGEYGIGAGDDVVARLLGPHHVYSTNCVVV